MKKETQDKLLALAKSFLHVREVPINSNKGKDVQIFQDYVGTWMRGCPWCAAYVSYLIAQVYEVSPIGKQSSAIQGIWTKSKTNPKVERITPQEVLNGKTLEPGDIFVTCSNPDKTAAVRDGKVKAHTGHTGLVTGPNEADKSFPTNEGNTNPKGSREGGGCYNRTRKLTDPDLVGFIRIKE